MSQLITFINYLVSGNKIMCTLLIILFFAILFLQLFLYVEKMFKFKLY